MNILFIKHFIVGCIVSEIPRVSVFGHCPFSVTSTIGLFIYICIVLPGNCTSLTMFS